MDKEAFYDSVAMLLETDHVFIPDRVYMRRWGPRTPGNGRFPGHGIVRAWSPDTIHIALHTPALTGSYSSYEDALADLIRVTSKEL